jgi:hypothetical protein
MRKLTKEEFVERSIKKHGYFYDYSKVEYINSYTKVLIICPIHGEFWQRPDCHLNGQGCPHCVGVAKLTKEEFVERSLEVHSDWYDYSKVEYINCRTKVLIICPDHGEFWQRPDSHLNGNGCPICGSFQLTKEEFVEKAILVHSVFYDYSKVVYINNRTKVLIICPYHGEFWQMPHAHLSGSGCPHCVNSAPLTKEIFVERSILVHGDFYDYSKVVYVNANTKVCIICPIHGEFWQTPYHHLRGHGCPYCKKSKLEMFVNKILTDNNINFIQSYREFDWLRNKLPLELDFYLPKYNIAIECQGKQHFECVERFGGEQEFINVQYRDKIKKQLCEEHGVKLFYINYNDNVEEKIEEIVKNI